MSPKQALPAIACLLMGALPAAGMAPPSDPECEDGLPFVLNAAFAPTGRFDLAQVGDLADRLFTGLYRGRSPCAGVRALQVNLAIGSDYQILHWLRDGSVDVAVVSDLALHLLGRDGVELLEIEPPAGLGPAILPEWRPRLEARRVGPDGGVAAVGPQDALELLRERSWAGLADDSGALGLVAREGTDRCGEPDPTHRPPGPEVRLTLPSHLSSTGFLAPVADTQAWLEGREAGLSEALRPAAEACFWHRVFRHTCFRLEGDRIRMPGEEEAPPQEDPCSLRWRRAVEGEVVELRIERELVADAPEEVAGREAGGLRALGQAFRDQLVIRRPAAENVFGRGEFPPAEASVPEALATLLDRAATRGQGAESPVSPETFRAFAAPEPYFGVRPFAFTAGESVRLLREHQRLAGRQGLALVLPGGGVKAAYQSRLVDSLYAEGRLRNAGVGGETHEGGEGSLDVHHVIGTSGGALLGYFVARLGPRGPWELSRLLWEKEPGVVLSAADVFGSTDLPRYLSVLVVFGLFCVVLLAFSVGVSSPLSPRSRPPTAGVWRLRLTFVVFPLLLLTPLLVRSVGGELQEHVPEIEGLLYLVVVVLAMFADQCVVHDPSRSEAEGPRVSPLIYAALASGVLAMAVPLLGSLGTEGAAWIGEPLPFGLAHLLLGALVLVAAVILPVRGPLGLRTPEGRRRSAVAAGDAVLALAVVPVAALWLGPTLRLIGTLPVFVNGFLLILLVGSVWTVAVRERGPSLPRRWRWLFYYAALAGATVLVLGLCRPEGLVPGVGLGETLSRPSRLGAPTGPFLVCLGAVVTLAAGTAWVVKALPRYSLDGRKAFTASLLVVVGHVLVVYLALMALGSWWSEGPSTLELTAGFWGWLVVLALATGLVVAGLASASRRGRPLVPPLRRTLLHLCGHHPNGAVLSRRFLRMLGLGALGLVWWNVVLAPAFYGNRHAEEVLELAMEQFDARYSEVHGAADPYQLTAQFVAPANVLERDGTRYFVVVPEEWDCPSLPRRNAPSAVWYLYHSDTGPLDHEGHGACRSLDLRTIEDRRLMRQVIFASGSPFPIFPGKVATLPPPDDGRKRLVDGGYSNDTPVEAALILGADQVLIVQSSHPLGHHSSPGGIGRVLGFLGAVPGPLVADLGRLPGYLFERSQQVDRQSRRDLFVVTLAPRRSERGWPPLSDFRARTVERMRRTAARDLEEGRRIGFVESWGPPRFQLSVTVEGARSSARL